MAKKQLLVSGMILLGVLALGLVSYIRFTRTPGPPIAASGAGSDGPPALTAHVVDDPNSKTSMAYLDVRRKVEQYQTEIRNLMRSDPDAAADRLKSAKEYLQQQSTEDEAVRGEVKGARLEMEHLDRYVQLARLSLEELEQKIREAPDHQVISTYVTQLTAILRPMVNTHPKEAERRLDSAQQLVDSLPEDQQDAPSVDRARNALGVLRKAVVAKKK